MQHVERPVTGWDAWHRTEMARLCVAATVLAVAVAGTLTGATLRLTAAGAHTEDTSGDTSPGPPPTSLTIPAIGLRNSQTVALGRTPSGVVEVPADAAVVGWLRNGTAPGETGPAIMSAHSALTYTHGAFHELSRLRRGDSVTVGRENGTALTFTVYRSERTMGIGSAVAMASTPCARPELRLLTWSQHDPGERGRVRSTVVFAKLNGAP